LVYIFRSREIVLSQFRPKSIIQSSQSVTVSINVDYLNLLRITKFLELPKDKTRQVDTQNSTRSWN